MLLLLLLLRVPRLGGRPCRQEQVLGRMVKGMAWRRQAAESAPTFCRGRIRLDSWSLGCVAAWERAARQMSLLRSHARVEWMVLLMSGRHTCRDGGSMTLIEVPCACTCTVLYFLIDKG